MIWLIQVVEDMFDFLGWMYPSVKVGKSTMRCTMFHEDYIFDLHDDDVGRQVG